ncbi:MAG: bifunctional phosphopantothenoylcysteine decarboxylase/phosphopantothenate synthase [Methanomassiliicoccales archaeon PtaU1.Bin124]|nr:MAG: bifunctional phosphopantothenoylcysteine decarboxylase/phosphopantothenate synthase [Methanomassiliicoccales archaeon PtaU1.Bin124]
MYPSRSIIGMKSSKLQGKRIVLGITGSIAAVECVELARELIRHGAEVHVVMSEEGAKIITPCSMEFATGNPVTTAIDGRVQHVTFFGNASDKADLLLIAPCTANTISKIAGGVDDTPVTTMATVALGSCTPTMIAPAMHAAMFANPFVAKNIEALKREGVGFIGPRMVEGKAKIAEKNEIVAATIRRLGGNEYSGKRLLIIGGSSEEPIDDMRTISNRGTGETAVELASAAYEMGAEVELWMGRCSVQIPDHIITKRFRTMADLLVMIDAIDHDLVLVPAALSDFAPEPTTGKIPTDRDKVTLHLHAMPKVLSLICRKEAKVVGFKAESGVGEAQLLRKANACSKNAGLDAIVANDLKDVVPGKTKVVYMSKDDAPVSFEGSKSSVAREILIQARRLL